MKLSSGESPPHTRSIANGVVELAIAARHGSCGEYLPLNEKPDNGIKPDCRPSPRTPVLDKATCCCSIRNTNDFLLHVSIAQCKKILIFPNITPLIF